MHRIYLAFLILLSLKKLDAQNQLPRYKKMISKIQSLYNKSNYDSIYLLFSPEMKKALPLKQTWEFFSNTKSKAGMILKMKFKSFESTYALYLTEFERGPMSLNLSLDHTNKINGLFIQPNVSAARPLMDRNTTQMILPLTGLWTVLWGGDAKEVNYHVEVPVQRAAFDFIIRDSTRKAFKGNGRSNEDYYAFGKEIIAPCNGEVVLAVDGIKDNIPGQTNPMFVTGNTVVIKTDKNEYLWFAHFKQHTVSVKEGQRVKTGEVLGLCGNSGNSSEPHLHFHIQNVEDINTGTGVKCFFHQLFVNDMLKTDYSPVKDEEVRNASR